ncbi:tRNA (adenosine(37)-N6)-dimethylallyltransferase MiaA [Lewinella cohaerens]|uniref:tRNA (adenosine(37)-N6)-dimethylallyltransferase MiaA n=1 Tax=Lewinella cohaerens TaxID=70995 RepID=UPI0003785C0A|nr:tRNA (adenosine(37)-N6)-dimethylallyltransferase MiaA [Lewinella cohaerens]
MSVQKKYLLVVGGPTASGKTSLAIALAKHFSTEIISADSRQFYEEMKIGNARPEERELAEIKHHLIADRPLTDSLSAGACAREAQGILAKCYETSDYAVLVGGSGLFIRALTEGLDEFPEVSAASKAKVAKLFKSEGLAGLQTALAEADPDYYEEVDLQNPVRLQRALEVCWSSGKKYSGFRAGKDRKQPFVPIYLQPSWPRETLYQRINLRVEHMVEQGLEAEVRQLMDWRELPALQTVGYQEWWPYFEGSVSKKEVITLIQQNSRRYAKRQLTWNRRDGYWKHVPQGDLRTALTYIQLVIQEGLALTALPKEEACFLNKREDQKRLGLKSIDKEEVVGVADLYALKDFAFIKCWFGAAASHLAKTLLLHEACYRSEKAVVYLQAGYLSVDFLLANGWVNTETETLPRALKEKLSGEECWRWERSEQVF